MRKAEGGEETLPTSPTSRTNPSFLPYRRGMNKGRRKNLSGLIASPLATLREGKPIAFKWVISSVVKPGGSEGPSPVSQDGRYKLGFRAGKLYGEAPEEAHGRIEFDLRQLEWCENEFYTEWQSYATLGGAMGARSGATKTRLGQFTAQGENEVRAYSGFVDFPVRYEINLPRGRQQ